MATGRLAAANLAAETSTVVYECPENTFAVVTVSICNRGNTGTDVRLSLGTVSPPPTSDFLEFDLNLSAKGVLERTGIVLGAGQKISAYSSLDNTSVVIYGIETSTV
jgi:hypothetical protein